MDILCERHAASQESISVIAEILSNNGLDSCEEITKQFQSLGINKVKDLAQMHIGNTDEISGVADIVAELNNALEKYDELCINRLKLAKSQYDKGFYILVQETCEKLYEFQPNDVNVSLLLSASYFMQGKYDQSLESLNKVPDEYCECVEVMNNKASNYFRKGKIVEARDQFYRSVTIRPDYINYWINYIKTLLTLKDHKNAILAIKMILFYNRDCIEVRHLYGNLLLTLNKVEDASKQFKLAIQINPDSAPSWTFRGHCYLINKEMKKAVVCYQKALQIDENLIITRFNLGFAYMKLKEYGKSIEILKSALRLTPKYPINFDILQILARIYIYQNNVSSAIKTYNLCVSIEPENADLYYTISLLYVSKLKKPAIAEGFLKKCIELNSENIKYYKFLTVVYQNQNKNELASMIALKMGDLYMSKNDITSAKNAFYYAIHLDPQNVDANRKLENVLCELKIMKRASLKK